MVYTLHQILANCLMVKIKLFTAVTNHGQPLARIIDGAIDIAKNVCHRFNIQLFFESITPPSQRLGIRFLATVLRCGNGIYSIECTRCLSLIKTTNMFLEIIIQNLRIEYGLYFPYSVELSL